MCSISSLVFFFFFKQKTAYEMRISDWSSDVCSSDLAPPSFPPPGPAPLRHDALPSGGHAAPPKYARRIAAPPPPRRRDGQTGREHIPLGSGAPPKAPNTPDLRGGISHLHCQEIGRAHV